MTAILLAAGILLTLTLYLFHIYVQARLIAEKTHWRIAMEFIAFEACDMPHEFAACYLARNHDAIALKFPQYADFVRDRIEDWEAE